MRHVLHPGPFVGIAALCHRVQRQPDGSVDLVGIVDTHDLGPLPLAQTDSTPLRLTAVIALNAGHVRGTHTIEVHGRYPEGLDGPREVRLIEFTDEEPDTIELIPVAVEVECPGTYWFDVLFDQRTISRISLVARRVSPNNVD